MSNINTTTIEVCIDGKSKTNQQIPALPSKWEGRFDTKVWNELSLVCNESIKETAKNTNRKAQIMLCSGFWLFFILALVLLITYFTPTEHCDEYTYYTHCDLEYNYDMFVASMVFWAFTGVTLISCYIRALRTCAMSHRNSLLMIKSLNHLNKKYESVVEYKLIRWNQKSCCCIPSNVFRFEIEIEMKVKQISYFDDIQIVNLLPTQEEVMEHPLVAITNENKTKKERARLIEEIDTNSEFTQKHYTAWNTKDVFNWIVSLDDGIFRVYQRKLGETLQLEQIDGNDICDLDKDDLHRLGIQSFKLKKCLLIHIQSLIEGSLPYETNAKVKDVDSEQRSLKLVAKMKEGDVTNC